MSKKITRLECRNLSPNSQVHGGRKKSRPIPILCLFYPPSEPWLLKFATLVLYDNKFMLSEATKFVAIGRSTNRKLIQQAVVCLGREYNGVLGAPGGGGGF